MLLLATHIVPVGTASARLSDYVRVAFPELHSRNAAKKAIKSGAILLDGQPCQTGLWVAAGMELRWYDLLPTPPKPYDLPLTVVWEDAHLAIIYKPAGLRVSGPQYRTLLNALPGNVQPASGPDALSWPKPVHRLDRATQGLMLIAKTRLAQVRLTQQFEARSIHKTYVALVMGLSPKQGELTLPIEGKAAQSTYRRLNAVRSLRNGWLSEVELVPHTGRTHQLRIHMAEAGFPILGDPLYGPEGQVMKGKGLFLAAIGLTCTHPETGATLTQRIEVPSKFSKRMQREGEMWARYQEG